VVVDQAGWHVKTALVMPERVQLIFLPAHAPELQPAERVWALVAEPTADWAFAALEQLEAALVRRCRTLSADHDRLKAHTSYHWWPPEPRPLWQQ
jgi:hypothetical protein